MTDNEMKAIRQNIACPQFGDDHYGSWGALNLNQRRAIKRMLEHINIQDEYINRQKAELDDLKRDDLPRCKDALRRANETGMGLEKENQELRAEVAILRTCKKQQMDEIKFLSASRLSMWDELNAHAKGYDKGIKEFAERLKADLCNIPRVDHGGHVYYLVGKEAIDNLVKEMVGEDNGEA